MWPPRWNPGKQTSTKLRGKLNENSRPSVQIRKAQPKHRDAPSNERSSQKFMQMETANLIPSSTQFFLTSFPKKIDRTSRPSDSDSTTCVNVACTEWSKLVWLCRCIPSSIDRMLSFIELMSCPACSCRPNWMATTRNRGTTVVLVFSGLLQKAH